MLGGIAAYPIAALHSASLGAWVLSIATVTKDRASSWRWICQMDQGSRLTRCGGIELHAQFGRHRARMARPCHH